MVSGCPKPFCHRNKSALKHNRAGLDTKFGFLLARFELPLLRFGLRRLFVFLLVRIFLLFLLLLLLRLYFGRRRLMRRRRWRRRFGLRWWGVALFRARIYRRRILRWRRRRWPLRRFLNCGWPLGRHGLRVWRWGWPSRLIVNRLIVCRRPVGGVGVGSRWRSGFDYSSACVIGARGRLSTLGSNSCADDRRRRTRRNTGTHNGCRRCDTGDDSGLGESNRWSGRRGSYAGRGRNVAGTGRCKQLRSLNHAYGLQLFGRDANGGGLNRLGADESFTRDRSDGCGIIRVGVVDAVDRHVVDDGGGVGGVVNVGDLRNVNHSCVGDVDVLNVRGTRVVRGQIHVTRA